MKQVKMHIVTTQVNGKPNHKPVETRVLLGVDYRSGSGLPIHANKVILSEETTMVDVFEVGDRVSCEVNRGSVEDEDGLVTGGAWITKTGTITKEFGSNVGYVEFDDFDSQVVSLIRGNKGYPGRNIQPSTANKGDNNPLHNLKTFAETKFTTDTAVVQSRDADGKHSLRTPHPDALFVEFSYDGWGHSDQEIMKSAFETQPKCVLNCRPFGQQGAVYFCESKKAYVFKCDGNYTPSILIPMAELDDFLNWMDKHFIVNKESGSSNWRTDYGAYSRYNYTAIDLTIDDIKKAHQSERFWSSLK